MCSEFICRLSDVFRGRDAVWHPEYLPGSRCGNCFLASVFSAGALTWGVYYCCPKFLESIVAVCTEDCMMSFVQEFSHLTCAPCTSFAMPIRAVFRQAAGLSSMLEDSTAQNTFFAPTDQAFLDFENQLRTSNATLLANIRLAKQESPCHPANALHISKTSSLPQA